MVLFFSGCDSVELDINPDKTAEVVYKSEILMWAMVNNVYSSLPDGFDVFDGAMRASASDEAEYIIEGSSVERINNGEWDQFNNPDDVWGNYYSGIRKANNTFRYIDSINYDILRFDPDRQVEYQSKLEESNNWKYEVRFIRAYLYFELLKRYGGIPIIDEVIDLGNEDEYLNVPRNTFQEVVDFIVTECNIIADNLPDVRFGDDLGRISKGMALALKSRTLLYSASDLYNTPSWAQGYAEPELIAMPAGDRMQRWRDAADASKEVIDFASSIYFLSSSFEDLFGSFDNSELIFVRRNGNDNSFESTNFSPGYRGNGGNVPSQNIVDLFEVVDPVTNMAMPFDWNNPDHVNSPYSNRDPRFYDTVLANGSNFQGRVLETYPDGRDGTLNNIRASTTGYYLNKYVNEGNDLQQGNSSVHSWIIFRLSEIYLNYAEALNEFDPGNPEIAFYINEIRSRANMPDVQTGLSQSEIRNFIRNEKAVEFAFEDHRLWDLRRWMLAPTVLSKPLEGVKVTNNGNVFSYEKIEVEKRVFTNNMYFYPIPNSEVQIGNWNQNPGW